MLDEVEIALLCSLGPILYKYGRFALHIPNDFPNFPQASKEMIICFISIQTDCWIVYTDYQKKKMTKIGKPYFGERIN